jgi:hypothetical protein
VGAGIDPFADKVFRQARHRRRITRTFGAAREGSTMNRLLRTVAALFAATLLCPASAFAYESQFTPLGLHLVVSATGLAVAFVLLFEVLRLRKIALGGAIAEKLYFVMLAIVCLASSALAKWTSNFVSGLTFEQTELVSELLVILAMALFAAYFYSVGTAMRSYLKVLRPGTDDQAASQTEEPEAKPGA